MAADQNPFKPFIEGGWPQALLVGAPRAHHAPLREKIEALVHHPGDFLALLLEGASAWHAIDAVRILCQEAYLPPNRGPVRFFWIEDADRMQPPAANALLKALEEPAPTSRFLLVTAFPHRLLPTIKSRCQRFDLMVDALAIEAELVAFLSELDQCPYYKLVDFVARWTAVTEKEENPFIQSQKAQLLVAKTAAWYGQLEHSEEKDQDLLWIAVEQAQKGIASFNSLSATLEAFFLRIQRA